MLKANPLCATGLFVCEQSHAAKKMIWFLHKENKNSWGNYWKWYSENCSPKNLQGVMTPMKKDQYIIYILSFSVSKPWKKWKNCKHQHTHNTPFKIIVMFLRTPTFPFSHSWCDTCKVGNNSWQGQWMWRKDATCHLY